MNPTFRPRRRGMTSVLAMMYLILFSTLAIGFYAAVNTSVQISGNETASRRALLSAESGMEFMRYQLANVTIPHKTAPEEMWAAVCAQLKAQMDDTNNLAGADLQVSGTTLIVPTIVLSGGKAFSATVSPSGEQLVVTVTGQAGTSSHRAIQMKYQKARRASAIFNYGVASKGRIVTTGSARIRGATDPAKGSVLSADPDDPTPVDIGGKEVSGDISITNPAGRVRFDAGASIGGTNDPNKIRDEHLHVGVVPPEFPTVDTTAFKQYAVNKYTGGKVLDNAYIPANSNVKFTGGATIRGVLYIEAPNNIEFRGNVDVQGVIVVANDVTTNLTKNVLDFSGNVTARGVETLPDSYGNLKKLTGSFILAPGFLTTFTGSFGTVNGSIIASQVTMGGNAGGTVVGSVINLERHTLGLNGSSEINIVSTGTSNYPSGVFFSQHFAPLPGTYMELQ